MTKLTANPSLLITANGEYESSSEYPAGSSVVMEVYGTRGGASVQPGIRDPSGNFEPVGDPVTDAAKPACWRITLGVTGIPAIKIAAAGGATSLRLATTPTPA